jgi:polysaccharide export outer membrane protein
MRYFQHPPFISHTASPNGHRSRHITDDIAQWMRTMLVGMGVSTIGVATLVCAMPSPVTASDVNLVQSTPVLPPPPVDGETVASGDGIDASTVTINDYILGVGDRLQIDVFDSPEYSGEFEVLADGTLRMPFVRAVQARGLTIEQTSARISQQYAPILKRPLVSIRVIEARPVTLAITGEVSRPGSYRVDLADTDGLPTVTQALQLAGGITQRADVRSIQVQRFAGNPNQPSAVISVDLWKLLQDADLRQDIALQDGDRIIIPEATDILVDELDELSNANISEQMTVNVVGEVGSPGPIAVNLNTTLNQAILEAGGFNSGARRRRVDLVRLNSNGTITNREIDIDLNASPNDENNPILHPNDIVVVDRSTFTRVTDNVSRALSPALSIFSLFRIFGL